MTSSSSTTQQNVIGSTSAEMINTSPTTKTTTPTSTSTSTSINENDTNTTSNDNNYNDPNDIESTTTTTTTNFYNNKSIMKHLYQLALGSDYNIIQSLENNTTITIDDDIIVEHLLTQFPTYGSNHNVHNNTNIHNIHNTLLNNNINNNNNNNGTTGTSTIPRSSIITLPLSMSHPSTMSNSSSNQPNNNNNNAHIDFWLGSFGSSKKNNNGNESINNNYTTLLQQQQEQQYDDYNNNNNNTTLTFEQQQQLLLDDDEYDINDYYYTNSNVYSTGTTTNNSSMMKHRTTTTTTPITNDTTGTILSATTNVFGKIFDTQRTIRNAFVGNNSGTATQSQQSLTTTTTTTTTTGTTAAMDQSNNNTTSTRNGSTKKKTNYDWDEDEQSLWKEQQQQQQTETSTTIKQKRTYLAFQQNHLPIATTTTTNVTLSSTTNTSTSIHPRLDNVNIVEGVQNKKQEIITYNSKPTISTSNNTNEQHQQQQQQQHKTTTTIMTKYRDDNDERQYWMPDQLCKVCTSCEIPFTVFRRRHHCRLCGQVFCNTCSAYFVPMIVQSNTTTTTPNQNQHQHQLQSGIDAASTAAVGSSVTAGNSTTSSSPNRSFISKVIPSTVLGTIAVVASAGSTPTTTSNTSLLSSSSIVLNGVDISGTEASSATTGTTSTVRVCKMCHEQMVTSSKQQQYVNDHSVPSSHYPVGIVVPQHQYADVADVVATTDTNDNIHNTGKKELVNDKAATAAVALQMEETKDPKSPSKGSNKRHQPTVIVTDEEVDISATKITVVTSDYNRRNTETDVDNVHNLDDSSRNQTIKTPVSPPPLLTVVPSLPLARRAVPVVVQNPITNRTKTDYTTGTSNADPVETTSYPTQGEQAILDGKRHLGLTAARHLEEVTKELLRTHAPILWKVCLNNPKLVKEWVNQLLSLATRSCATIDPNVKKGDLLDIRPYVKVKVISGSTYNDCQYVSGVLFRKNVTHKKMAKEVDNPHIMLLSGGIEFNNRTGTENRIASLETLFEQEDTYMELLVGKILKVQPDIVLIGRSASRKAQELLLKAGVILIQHVKVSLLTRISRQTGATIISSTDHVMNRFGPNVLGKCKRFRLVVFRDNEIWTETNNDIDSQVGTISTRDDSSTKSTSTNKEVNSSPVAFQSKDTRKSINSLLCNPKLSNHERQAALAASQLGEGVIDGSEAIKSGLAKRGVSQTYVLLEGCPKHLGCTVVLRGASKESLQQVKIVFRFLVNIAYNLKLETSYLRERGARIRPDFKEVSGTHTYSTSLCVDYGDPGNRKIRPWNGGNDITDPTPRPESGEITSFDHQSILITSVWMTDKTQCCPAEVKGICNYSLQDVSLGQFLRDSCFNLSLKCQNPNCKKSVIDHTLSFVHNDGLIQIAVEEMEERLPTSPSEPTRNGADDTDEMDEETDKPIATWTYCQRCEQVVTPLVFISENTWKWSFGKFLEVFFYNRDAIMNAPTYGCSCQLQTDTVLYYGCGKLAARFTYEPIAPFGVFIRHSLPIEYDYHRDDAMSHMNQISDSSAELFASFASHIEKVTREARNLFNSAVNRPEHLQTVLSELNRIASESDHVAKTLQEKILSVIDNCKRNDDPATNAALLRFPWFARRYVFNLATAWNEKLRYTGQAISAMKKIASAASRIDSSGLGPNVSASVGDPYHEELTEGMKKLRHLIDHYANVNVTDINQALPAFPGVGDAVPEGEFDDDFDDPESTVDFTEGVDADVLASRRRLVGKGATLPTEKSKTSDQRPSKALGTRRSVTDQPRLSQGSNNDTNPLDQTQKPTPGGAVKSAITRFFNRGGRDYEQYIVNLGIFSVGRPRLSPGVNGRVVPVLDEQLNTIIAYSLTSIEYSKQFKQFSRQEGPIFFLDTSLIDRTKPTKPDLDAGIENYNSRERPNDDSYASQRNRNSSPLSHGTKSSIHAQDDIRDQERRILARNKSHIKHTFRDIDEKGLVTCKFVCTSFWATQFHAVRQVFLSPNSTGNKLSSSKADGEQHDPLFVQTSDDIEQSYIDSLSSAEPWAASGGKSGASFSRTSDGRFVIKCISRTELQMFLDCAPAYFEYLTKAFFHGLPTALCKIVGVYQIGVHNKITGKRSMEQVAVMQNIFYKRRISRIFDLKGSLRGRFAAQKDEQVAETPSRNKKRNNINSRNKADDKTYYTDGNRRDGGVGTADTLKGKTGPSTLLDGDFLEFTSGRPMPLTDRAKAVFQMSILNDTLFLSIINVLDYSILIGVDEDSMELVVGIIDFMRQYDILKQMERVGKSLPMVVGSEAPTIIQPPLYKARFTNAMERYFMTVPSKWTTI